MTAYASDYVSTAKKYIGTTKGSRNHHKIIDLFNKDKPDGYAMDYVQPWCAAFVSAIVNELGGDYKDIIPRSASCSIIINKAQRKGIWVENDAYVPEPGDLILYDWEDDGKGDNKGAPNHIGIVTEINGSKFEVIEGNMTTRSVVGYRTMSVNGRYIRGFVHPHFSKKAVNTVKYRTKYGPNKILGSWRANGEASGAKKYRIRSLAAFTGEGELWYRARTRKSHKWTDWVPAKSWLPNAVYDRIQFKLKGCDYKIKYRVYVKKHGWLDWVAGYNNKNDNGYAGLDNYGIRKIEVKAE